MKKIALLLALVLIMSCAYAEPVLMNSLVNVDLVYNSNLLYSRGHNGYALMDYEGNLLTEDIYNGFNYHGGMVSCYLANAEGVNRHGILKDDGSVILPFKYGDVNVLSEDWIYGVVLKEATRDNFEYEITIGEEKTVYQIDYVDILNLNTGKMLTLTRENFEEIHAMGYTVNIKDRSTGKVSSYDQDFNVLGTDLNSTYSSDYAVYDFQAFYDHGRYGVKDAQGNVFVEPAYDRIFYDEGEFALIEDLNERTGAMDLQGNVVLEPQFDDLEYMRYLPHREYSYGYAGYFCFIQDGKIGYATSAGITCEPKYSEDILDCNGVSCSFTDLEGNYNIMAADGVITPVTGYRDVSPAYFAGGFYYIVSNEDYDDGLIDWHGNVIFPCEYNSIEFSVEGQYVLVSPDYGTYEIYTLNQAEAAAPAVEAPAAEAPAIETPAAEVPAGNKASALLQKVKSGMGAAAAPAAEAPAAEAPAAEAAVETPVAEAPADNSAAVALLQSVKALVTADAAANAGAIATLLDSAIASLPGSPALGLLDSVKALLAVDPAANAGAIATLLDSAIAML